MKYVIDDDERINVQLDECRQFVLSSYRKWCDRYGGGDPRVTIIAMLSVLIDHAQLPGTAFSPEKAHILCRTVHEVADLICAHNMTTEQLAAVMGLQQEADPDYGEPNNTNRHLH